jgi:hypothetical protein
LKHSITYEELGNPCPIRCRCKNVNVIPDTVNVADEKTVLLIQMKYLVSQKFQDLSNIVQEELLADQKT